MADKKQETEEQIFEAACRVFQRKGYSGARMQEIADEANINKSMLHYYYRSKDKLFQKVYQEEMSRFFPSIFEILQSGIPLDEKVEQLIEIYYRKMHENPNLAHFVLIEMNHHPERFKEFIRKKGIHPPDKYFHQTKEEMEKANMRQVKPEQLWISIVSLILFPFVSKTMIQGIYNLDEEEFEVFLTERKSFLVEFILNGINYKNQ